MKTCKKHIKDPVICYSDCAGCEMQRLTDERNQLKAENEALKQDANFRAVQSIRADFNECAAALPGPYYMDPPDGGDVSVAEQLRRMAKDAERYRWLKEKGLHHSIDAATAAIEPGVGPFICLQLPSPGAPTSCRLGASADEYIDQVMSKEG